jgi:hypothetical protein
MYAYIRTYITAHTHTHTHMHYVYGGTYLELMFANPYSECAECEVTGVTDCNVKL